MKKEVNIDFIVTLESNDDQTHFTYKEIPIEDLCVDRRRTIEQMSTDKETRFETMVERFKHDFPDYYAINYCYNEYHTSYLTRQNPLAEIKDYINKIKSAKQDKIEEVNRSKKDNFKYSCIRWIKAYNYEKTLVRIKTSNLKVWSTETIGWSNFNYTVHHGSFI